MHQSSLYCFLFYFFSVVLFITFSNSTHVVPMIAQVPVGKSFQTPMRGFCPQNHCRGFIPKSVCYRLRPHTSLHQKVKVTLWTLFTRENYDVGRKGKCTRNILQWEENNIKSRIMTNGDYYQDCGTIVLIPQPIV